MDTNNIIDIYNPDKIPTIALIARIESIFRSSMQTLYKDASLNIDGSPRPSDSEFLLISSIQWLNPLIGQINSLPITEEEKSALIPRWAFYFRIWQNYLGEDPENIPRAPSEVENSMATLTDYVWYQSHLRFAKEAQANGTGLNVENRENAQRIIAKYGIERIGPYTEAEWASINGKLTALRWLFNMTNLNNSPTHEEVSNEGYADAVFNASLKINARQQDRIAEIQ